MHATISVRNLVKDFDGYRALKGIDLDIPAGRLVTLLGPSGCGKTTLLRIIAGIADPTEGEILLHERRIDGLPPEKRNFGMVFQTYALFPHMSVARNVAFGLEMRRVPKAEIRRRVAAALSLVGLESLSQRLPRQLSGGQQQRVAVARAIVIEPDMLLFDEPLSNLDAKLRDSLREDLRALQKKLGIAAIYVTHDQAEAMALADEIVVMKEGAIVERGAPIDLYRRPRYRFTAEFLGMTNVIAADLQGERCRLPWGEERVLENPGVGNAEGVALRPEDLMVSPVEADHHGVVVQAVFMGASTHYTIDTGGQALRAIAAGGLAEVLREGQKVRLTAPARLHLLEAFDDKKAVSA